MNAFVLSTSLKNESHGSRIADKELDDMLAYKPVHQVRFLYFYTRKVYD